MYNLEDVKKLEADLNIPREKDFIEYVRELDAFKQEVVEVIAKLSAVIQQSISNK